MNYLSYAAALIKGNIVCKYIMCIYFRVFNYAVKAVKIFKGNK